MFRAESFAHFGLYIARDFLNAIDCEAVRAEIDAAQGSVGTIHRKEVGIVHDPKSRSVKVHKICRDVYSRIADRFQGLLPLLSQHFGLTLRGFEKPQFLCYEPGDFFGPHTDESTDTEAPAYMRDRKVSVVLFLNSAAVQPQQHTYGGGSLKLYGLVPDPRWEGVGLGLDGVEGLLTAFRSDIPHEVTPVIHGKRYSLVTWYY